MSIVIDSMTPQTAKPGSTVTVAGTVTNGTSQTKAGLDVQLWTSSARFQTRDEMDGYVSHGTGASLVEAGNPFSLTASLKPGATVQWHASFQVDTVGMDQFGVYPVSAQLGDGDGDVLGVDQTLLPFWPGQQAAGLARPLDIAWVWPLVDQPHHQVCTALTNNDLATSLAPGGRLSALLGAGLANPGAHVTWVVDPALLSDVNTMTKPYQVASGPGCSDPANEPASKAATTWLNALRGITAGQPPVITPYANVDVSALVHSGLAPDITSAYSMGYAVADSVLHGSFGPTIAVPAGRDRRPQRAHQPGHRSAHRRGGAGQQRDAARQPRGLRAGRRDHLDPDAVRGEHDHPARRPRADRGAGRRATPAPACCRRARSSRSPSGSWPRPR